MPHAVFDDAPPLEEFWRAFAPFKERRPDGSVIEARAAFLRRDGAMLLVECLVIERSPPRHFYVNCDRHGDRVTVRCPQTAPLPRTDGVIEVVTRIARQFRALGGTVRTTNLEL